MSLESLKRKLMTHTGTDPSSMRLLLRPRSPASLSSPSEVALSDPTKVLGYYSPQDGDTLHVIDDDPTSASAGGWLEDLSKVDKYVMSDEDYARRKGTFREYKLKQLEKDPSWTLQKDLEAKRNAQRISAGRAAPPADGSAAAGCAAAASATTAPSPTSYADLAAAMPLGSRCEVRGGKRGSVQYVGPVESLPAGLWVGVRYDEPVGKHDGQLPGGKRFFECPPKHGGFVRPNLVAVGDFPVIGLGSDDETSDFGDDDEL